MTEEGDRHARAIVEVADEAEPAAAAHEIHDGARRSLVVTVIADAAATEQSVGVQLLALVAQVLVDIGVGDGAIDGGRIGAGPGERQDRQLPVAHVQADADGRPELVLVAGENVLADDIDALGLGQEAIDAHRLDHDAAEVLPMLEGDLLAFRFALFGQSEREVGQRALVALGVDERRKPAPAPRGGARRHVEGEGAKETGDEPQNGIFGAPLQILETVASGHRPAGIPPVATNMAVLPGGALAVKRRLPACPAA